MADTTREHESTMRKLKNLFDDLSIAQVTAGALAAVTSMLLASEIGIYGSVIGVAVGSVVSAVASQLYKKFLSASAEKLRGVGGNGDAQDRENDEGREDALASSAVGDDSGASGVRQAFDSQATVALAAACAPDAAETVRLPAAASAAMPSEGGVRAEAGVYADAARVRANAARQRKARLQRRVIAVSAASAIVAVALCALIISIATAGAGVGEKPSHPSSGDAVSAQQEAPADSAQGHDGAPAPDGSAPEAPADSADAGGQAQGQNGADGSGHGADVGSGESTDGGSQSVQGGTDGSDGVAGDGASGDGQDGAGAGGGVQGGSSDGSSSAGAESGQDGDGQSPSDGSQGAQNGSQSPSGGADSGASSR